MEILFITRLYYPHIGGIEKHIREISRRLIKKGHKVTVICTKHKSSLKNYESVGGVRVHRIRYPNMKVIGLFVIWYRLLKMIEKINKVDILHIHDVFIWYLPLRLLLPGKKVYMTFHGYPDYPLPKMAIINQKLAVKLTSGNIVIGKFIEKWFGTKADVVSYGAVDSTKYKPSNKKKLKYDAVFASRLDKHTGILTYLDAIRILKKQGYNFKLLVLGDGKFKKEADKLARTMGWVIDPSKYFGQCRWAFVNRYLAILEAFASKKLVFSVYDNPIKKDYLFMTPFKRWMVIERTPEKLAKKILYYKKRTNKVDNKVNSAYRWVREQTWEEMVNNYITLWS